MDKDYLLDLMVNVRERMIPVDEAVETICALADTDTGEKQCNLPVVMQRSELLLFADYYENDKTSQTTDEVVDNYLAEKSNSA